MKSPKLDKLSNKRVASKSDSSAFSNVEESTQLQSKSCNDEIQSLRDLNKKLKDKISLLQIQLQTQCRLHAAAHKRYGSDSCRCKRIISSSSAALNDSVEIKQELINQTEEKQAIHNKYEARIKELEEILKQKTVELDNNDYTKMMDNIEIIKLRRRSKRQQAQIDTLEPQLDCLEKKLARCLSDLHKSTSKNESLIEKNDALSNKLSELEIKNATRNAEHFHIQALEERIADLERERTELKKTVDQLNQIIDQQGDDIVHSDRYKYRIDELEALNNEMVRELAEEKQKNIQIESRLSELKEKINHLKVR